MDSPRGGGVGGGFRHFFLTPHSRVVNPSLVDVADPRGDQGRDGRDDEANQDFHASPGGQVDPVPANRTEGEEDEERRDDVPHHDSIEASEGCNSEPDDGADKPQSQDGERDQPAEGPQSSDGVDELVPPEDGNGAED